MVKKGVFEWIETGRKNIELRRGKAKQGNNAVFQCEKNIIRGVIVRKDEGSLRDVLREDNYKNMIPSDACVSPYNMKFLGLFRLIWLCR